MATTFSSSSPEDSPPPSTTTSNTTTSTHPTPPPSTFFTRNHLPPSTLPLINTFVRTLYPSLPIYPPPTQGYCSYTLCAGETAIIQFRPPAHRLNITLSSLARQTYDVFAPLTHSLGVIKPNGSDPNDVPLYVYCMTRIPGLSLAEFRSCPVRSAGEVRLQRAIIVRDFARFLGMGWNARRNGRMDVPFKGGRLGGTLRWRCQMMRDKLPVRFRGVVEDVLKDLGRIERLPYVLTHGDVSPDNVMVEGGDGRGHSETGWRPGSLRGLLDWAESEYLPFGVGLYGAEELFGQSVRQWEREGKVHGESTEARSRFTYYPTAGDLRRLFWEELEKAIPPLATDRELRATVEQARILGILLWHGFAFDDGKLDRVVEEGRDDEEIQKLDMFLFGTDHPRIPSSPVAMGERASEKKLLQRSSFRALVRCLHLPG